MMDEQNAKQILRDIFTNRFDNDNFILFVKELFNRFDYDRRDAKQEDISKDFQEFIDSFSSFGRYEDSEKKFVEILSVKLKKSNPESARTMQRNFIAKYLTQHNADAALVAFYGDEVDNWRLSFVKLEYHLEKDDKGNIKPATTLTPPKRYSFLVGKTEPSHTAQSQFLGLLMFQDQSPTISEIETSFSVEKVTKEFFEKYKELFLELEESMDHIIKQNKNLAKEFEEKGISTVDFAKKLLGQIVFIYFLQKKGWLGIEKDEAGKFKEWGTGHKDFLKRLYNKNIVDYNNFFNDILEPLFYEALAKDRTTENDYYSRFNCKIPFLNGGLFEPLGEYDWTNVDILLDNKIFGKIIETFDLYNFTVKEDEPLEKEVAIDPEMLGKVFENLLEVKDRKSKGSYYTPREIVYYMCQKSLINYLETRTGIEKKNIDDFIYNGQISSQIRDNRDKIDKLLKDIKVVDPAIGSGAFPVGMMMEIIKARGVLTKLFPKEEQSKRTAYNFKRECIENNLYGVDIDPGAVDIAQLRLWLSLIVDEEDIHKIKPLPNLDYKIMCGNSLLDEFEGVKLFDERLLGEIKKDDYSEEIRKIEEDIGKLYEELGMVTTGKKKDYGNGNEIKREINKLKKKQQKLMATPKKEGTYGSLFEVQKIKESQKKLKQLRVLHKQFFNENNRKEKIELRKEIERLDWEFIEETLKEQENEEAKKKLEQIKKNRSKPFFLWKLYFSEVFQENGGFDVVFGNPPYVSAVEHSKFNKSERELYRKKFDLRGSFDLYSVFLLKGLQISNDTAAYSWIIPNKFLVSNYSEEILIKMKKGGLYATVDVSKYNVFHNVSVYPIIILGNKRICDDYKHYEIDQIEDLRNNNLKEYPQLFNYKTFSDYGIKIASGTTGFQAAQIKPLIANKVKQTKDSIPFIVSGCVDPYFISSKRVRYMGENYESPYIRYNPKIIAKSKWSFWYNEKIVIAGMTKRIEAQYCKEPLALGVGCYAIYDYGGFNPCFLLAILNSKFLSYYLNTKFKDKHLAGGYLAINKNTIEKLPLVDVIEQRPFIQLVDKILVITKNGDYLSDTNKQTEVRKLENMIDQLVYKLYKLTLKEIDTIENFYEKT
jgi:hypothetical protein